MELTKVDPVHLSFFQEAIDKSLVDEGDLVVAALVDKRVAGAVVYSLMPDTDTLRLKYLFVCEQYRGQGVGRTLVLDVAAQMEAGAVHVSFPDSAEDMYLFLEHMGFTLARDSDRFSIEVHELTASRTAKKIIEGKNMLRSITLDQLSDKDRNLLKNKIYEAGAETNLLDAKGLYAPLSFVLMNGKTNESKACILCSRYKRDIVIEYLFSASDNPMTISELFGAFYHAVAKEGLLDANLNFVTEKTSIKRMLNVLAGKDMPPAGAMVNGLIRQGEGVWGSL